MHGDKVHGGKPEDREHEWEKSKSPVNGLNVPLIQPHTLILTPWGFMS